MAREALRVPVVAERALAGHDVRHRADVPVPAHDGRRSVPRATRARLRQAPGSCATAATASAAWSGCSSRPRRATWQRRRLGERRRGRHRSARSTGSSGVERCVRVLGALPGPSRLPCLERVRRHAPSRGSAPGASHGRTWLEWTLPGGDDRATLRLAAGRRACAADRGGCALNGVTRAGAPAASSTLARLPAPCARTFRLEILSAVVPARHPGRDRQRRAVGIAEVTRRRRAARRRPAVRGRCAAGVRRSRGRSAAARAAARRGRRSPTSTPAARCACAAAGRSRCGAGHARRRCRARRLRRTCCGCALPRPSAAVGRPGACVVGGATRARLAIGRPARPRRARTARARARLQPRLAGDVRRPRPRRARVRPTVRDWPGACPRTAARSRSRSRRTGS